MDLPQGGQVVPVVAEPPATVPSAHIEAVSPVVEAVQESPPLEGRDQGPEEADAPVSAPEVEQAEPQFLEEDFHLRPRQVLQLQPLREICPVIYSRHRELPCRQDRLSPRVLRHVRVPRLLRVLH